MNENKIIFVSFPNDYSEKGYTHFVAEAHLIEKGLRANGYKISSLLPKIEHALSTIEYGKVIIDGTMIYVAPSETTNLYSHQYPLIIIKDDKIIDVDEWWYTPFKKTLQNGYSCSYCNNAKMVDYLQTSDTPLCPIEYGYFTKCINKHDENDVLIATKTHNITFNID